jgi:rhodanese-related sulfurtransferase
MDASSPMSNVAELLARARREITRVDPSELPEAKAQGALIVDIRPEAQRASEGQLGFGVIVERNVFEWRFDLDGPDCLPEVQSRDQQIIEVCSEGYASSLAAAVLRELGFTAASDLVGGFRAWQAFGNREETASREQLATSEV